MKSNINNLNIQTNITKTIEDEYDSQFEDYRHINQENKEKHANDKLSELPVNEKLKKLNINHVMMDFDATSLYSSTMLDENSVYPKKSGFAF